MSSKTNIWKLISQIVATLKLFRVHIVITLIVVALFFIPQSQDVALAIHIDDKLLPLIMALFLGFGILPLVMWYSGRWLTLQVNTKPHPNKINGEDRHLNFLMRWIPRIAGITPCIAFSISLWTIDYKLKGTAILGLVAAVCWVLFFILRTKGSFKKIGATKNQFLFFNKYIQASLVFVILTSWVFVWHFPVQFPQTLGTIAAVLVFFSIFVLICSYLSWVYEFSGVPVMLLGFILTVVLAQFNLTDNHKIQTVNNTKMPQEQLLLEHAFQDWLEERRLKWDVENPERPYPVFIIAAEGGGIFAMQNAAFSLSILEDLTAPNEDQSTLEPFSHHTFAISTISGGSVGAGVFVASLADPNAEIGSGYRLPILREVVTKDFLSPIAANLFSLDFVQRFWPFSSIPDRNSAFRNAIHAGWEENVSNQSTKFLDEPFSYLWTGKKSPPYLVLNSLELNTGRTVAAAPFRFQRRHKDDKTPCYITPDIITQDGLERLTFREVLSPNTFDSGFNSSPTADNEERCKNAQYKPTVSPFEELTFIEAATTSARFPYVSPAGYLNRFIGQADNSEGAKPQMLRAQYVDGGYLEGSGVEPALTIVERLNRWIKTASRSTKVERLFRDLDKKVEIHLVSIELEKSKSITDSKLGTLLAPPFGLLATWGVRSDFAIEQAQSYFRERADNSNFYRILADDRRNEIPLGWHLSRQTSDKLLMKLFERKIGGQFDENRPGDVFCNLAQLTDRDLTLSDCHQKLETIKRRVVN